MAIQTISVVSRCGHPDFAIATQKLQANGFILTRQLLTDQAAEFESNIRVGFVTGLLNDLAVDWCVHQMPVQIAHVLICDMDSTLIAQECIDELADLAGVGDQVKAITEAAMAGDLDFATALTERVHCLAGHDEALLMHCWQTRTHINPGAKTLVATMKKFGANTALVSGGFTWFAKRVAETLGFDEFHANQLVIENGRIKGTIAGPILDNHTKLSHLQRLAPAPVISCAIGDGANDLLMVQGASLGIAYCAKPILEQSANGRIRHTDLRTALLFQGILPKDWV